MLDRSPVDYKLPFLPYAKRTLKQPVHGMWLPWNTLPVAPHVLWRSWLKWGGEKWWESFDKEDRPRVMLSLARRRRERFVVERRRAPHYYNPLPSIFPTSLLLFLPLVFVILQSFPSASQTHTLQIATFNRSSPFIMLKLPNVTLKVL